eukprot:m.53296 g.53296  ORF g.53296 m.53296 type:complete len:208 (+) comp34242_c0_seq24:718-1341(+)
MSLLAPKTTTYEWMGPVGSLFMMTGLPTVVYLLYFACNAQSCSLVDIPRIQLPPLGQWISQEAAIVFLAWLAFQAVIYAVNVGKIVKGSKLRDGSRLDYRINAFFAFVLSIVAFGALWLLGMRISFLYDQYLQLATVSVIFSCLLALAMFVKSHSKDLMLAEGGNTGGWPLTWKCKQPLTWFSLYGRQCCLRFFRRPGIEPADWPSL